MYNYDYKKIKLPSNPYSQLLVHNVASTFSGKRRDWYGVNFFFPVLKLDLKAIVVIGVLMRSYAQERDWKSRETRKGSFVGFTGLVWLNFQLCRLWLCGFGVWTMYYSSAESWMRYIYIYIYFFFFFSFNGCLDWWVMTLDSLGPCVTCYRQLALASTKARLASSYWYFWWIFFFFLIFAWWYFWWIK